MAFVVVYDASVLYGNSLRDLLIRVAQTGLVQAKWTHRIIDEALTAVAKIFVLDQIDIADRIIWGCVQQIANSRKQRPETVDDVLVQLERSGLVQSAAALRTS